MTEFDDLLERIQTPATDVNDDIGRGERALRRRRGRQITGAVASVAALAAVLVIVQGGPGTSGSSDPGFADQPGTARAPSPSAKAHHESKAHRQYLADQKAKRQTRRHLSGASTQVALQTYRNVLADHLDPGGTHLSGLSNEQGGGSVLGTKLDWNDGGMLEIVVGHSWGAAGGFYLLEDAGMTPTTYDGRPARTSTKGDDTVVSVEHADGTVVTLIASTSFGNNGTSTSATALTQHQLLAAAADPRLTLPPALR